MVRRRPLGYGYPRCTGSQFEKAPAGESLSQEELAHRAKIDRTYVSALEPSLYAAGVDVVDRPARALAVGSGRHR
jgi:hypothetical protein